MATNIDGYSADSVIFTGHFSQKTVFRLLHMLVHAEHHHYYQLTVGNNTLCVCRGLDGHKCCLRLWEQNKKGKVIEFSCKQEKQQG